MKTGLGQSLRPTWRERPSTQAQSRVSSCTRVSPKVRTYRLGLKARQASMAGLQHPQPRWTLMGTAGPMAGHQAFTPTCFRSWGGLQAPTYRHTKQILSPKPASSQPPPQG